MNEKEASELYGRAMFQKDHDAFLKLSMAAIEGDVEAQCWLGIFCKDGARNFEKAAEWLEKAAVQGNAEAQYHFGGLYATGQGVAGDLTKAAAWFEKAALQGHVEAMPLVATAYLHGLGVVQNREKAREWARKGADAGDETAAQMLRDEFCS
jgi:TPR repeat protein